MSEQIIQLKKKVKRQKKVRKSLTKMRKVRKSRRREAKQRRGRQRIQIRNLTTQMLHYSKMKK